MSAPLPHRRVPVAAPLREMRASRGLSQLALAAAAGVSIGTVADAERAGVASPRTLRKLAAVLPDLSQEVQHA